MSEPHHSFIPRWRAVAALGTSALLASVVPTVNAAPASASSLDLYTLSLEDLLAVRVTSVSRKEEASFGASAAIYVITAEDIHQLGPSDLPSALRFAPGVSVGRISTTNTALSPRGFNDVSANKLLALVDGRTIYTPLFGGVPWRNQDMVMQDIERIEVIRGPGATLWGANAVNGVVNITTKSAHETIGTLAAAGLGDGLTHEFMLRHGFALGERTDARIYAQTRRQEPFEQSLPNQEAPLDSLVAGFRVDHRTRRNDTLTFTGSFNESRTHRDELAFSLLPPYVLLRESSDVSRTAHLLTNYQFTTDAGSDIALKGYLDFADAERVIFSNRHVIVDVEGTVHHAFGPSHDVVSGAGIRSYRDHVGGSDQYDFLSRSMETWLFTAFVQDEITLIPDHLTVTIGSKIEHNSFTGWEVQPGIRAAWREGHHWTVWAAVARAVRTPTRAERGTLLSPQVIPPSTLNPLPTQVELTANPEFNREALTAWELGFRAQINDRVSFDFAGYFNDYNDIRSVEALGTSVSLVPVPHVIYHSISGNGIEGSTLGFEALVNWQALDHWRLQASWATLRYDLELSPGSMDMTSLTAIPGTTPRHEIKLMSEIDLGTHWTCGGFIWHQTELSAAGVPAYTGVNLRLAWRPSAAWEFALIGQDLLDRAHPEFPTTFLGGPTEEVPRSIRLKATWRH